MRHRALLFTFYLFAFTGVSAQQQLFTTYSINEGLVQNAVRDIFQDSKGFMWFGTWEGLSKYDGNKFTNFTTANGLAQGVINEIMESKQGVIYITDNDGSLFTIKKGILSNILKNVPVINHIQLLPNNKLIATSDHSGLYEFRDEKLVKPDQPYPKDNYYSVTPFNDSLFVALSEESVQLLTYDYRLYAEYRVPEKVFTECGLLTDSKKRIWVGTVRGLKLLSPSQEKNTPLRFAELPASFNIPVVKDQWIKDIMEDKQGNIWIGTIRGLARIGTDNSRQLITEKNGLPAADVSRLYQDREENIWIGSSKGVTKLVTKAGISIYNEQSGLFSDNIGYLFPCYDGNILAGAGNTMQCFNRSKGSFTSAASDKIYYSAGREKSGLILMQGKKYNSNFIVFAARKDEPVYFSPNSSGGYFAFKDYAGNYFFPSTGGLQFSRDFVNWKVIFLHDNMRTMLIDKDSNLWAGSFESGLYRISYKYYNDTPVVVKQEHCFPAYGFRSLYQDSKGYIWAGTRFNGVFRFRADDAREQTALHFDQSSGLTSGRIVSIAEDRGGSIWLNFYHGLDKLVHASDSFRVFNFSRFYNFFSNIQSVIFDRDHSMWLATTQGMIHITDSVTENSTPLPVYITAAVLGDSIYRDSSNKKVVLNYRHKQVQFEFAAPGFLNEKQIQYSYRLIGSNNSEWSKPSNDHLVSYANLDHGSYQFEVRTPGWNGQWGEPAVFSFIIKPPYWKTGWFRLAVLLLTAGIIFILVRRRIKHIRHEAELKQKITESEMMALRAQMNPHFIFNCLNAIDNLVQTNQKEKATTYLARFARLIRNVLDSAKNNVVLFQKDFESLQLYLQMEQFRCSNRFEYNLTADNELLHGDYKVPPLIVQPFVENAIHHGLLNKENNDRKLDVLIALKNEWIEYSITDNGIGREKANRLKQMNKPEHQSYGISITEERIQLYNQGRVTANDINITDLYENNRPCGTKVVIRLKIPENT